MLALPSPSTETCPPLSLMAQLRLIRKHSDHPRARWVLSEWAFLLWTTWSFYLVCSQDMSNDTLAGWSTAGRGAPERVERTDKQENHQGCGRTVSSAPFQNRCSGTIRAGRASQGISRGWELMVKRSHSEGIYWQTRISLET